MLAIGRRVNICRFHGLASLVLLLFSPVSMSSQPADTLLAIPISRLSTWSLSESSIDMASYGASGRSGEMTGAIVGGIAGAVFANLMYCIVEEVSCGAEAKPIIWGFLVGAVIGAGFGSAADD